MKRRAIQAFTLLPLLLAAAGCSRVTQANYDKLKAGMSYEQVESILGRPSQCSEVLTVRTCIWGDEGSNINANFINGQAVLFSNKNIR